MTTVGEQFRSGDQGDARERLWRSGFSTCPSCSAKEIKSEDHVAGVRHNGDGYGTTTFKCGKCKWNTSFQYDEAAETYYYETKSWDRHQEHKVQHSYAGLPKVTIDPDLAGYRRFVASDKKGAWEKGPDGRWKLKE